MKAEQYAVRQFELAGWPVRVTTYRIGVTWHAKADNVSPGALIATASADTLEQAEETVIEKARTRLASTRRLH